MSAPLDPSDRLMQEFVRRVIDGLEAVKVPYMVVGSLASSAHGKVRGTNDVDVVIAIKADELPALIREFEKDLYADLNMALEALRHETLFNFVDFSRGLKVDLIPLKQHPFDRMQFSRRRLAKISTSQAWTASPEDTLLSKLRWAKLGDSERQYWDAVGIAGVQENTLDIPYLRKWAVELNVKDLLDKLFEEVGLSDAQNNG